MTLDYKDTLFLPQTDFPMRANLPAREPEILAHWEQIDLFKTLTKSAEGRDTFVLHFGPPYANGNIHLGHALQKSLKDMVVRTQFALGKNAPMVPGWDCHGLPIEWKIEEKYRKENRDKDTVPILQFRAECREFAAHWVRVHIAEMKRLGVVADWDNPYLTMNFESEAAIAAEIHKFLMNGLLYRGTRPVMWSVVEKTALAQAEVEYHEYKSPTITVAFPVKKSLRPELDGASVLIWTTTPWTIPANRAVAYGAAHEYGVYEVTDTAENALAERGAKYVLHADLAASVFEQAGLTVKQVATVKGGDLIETVCAHPFAKLDTKYGFDVPLLAGDFVTTDTGTGFVHMAPSHGEDDYYLCKANGIAAAETVNEEGVYTAEVPVFEGLDIYNADGKEGKANGAVIKALIGQKALVHKGSLRHQYPHSWRSKAPLIFRTTAQWFIAVDQDMGRKGSEGETLREKSLREIDATVWVPPEARNRIHAMVSERPDWCISRQRTWGVPIAIFVNKSTREPLRDEKVNARIVEFFTAEGADAWYARPAQDFLGSEYNAADFEQVMDIVDVWFESGSTHAFVLEARPDQHWPADLYIEGHDQHRGWFQASLLESVGTRGRAPFKTVSTIGFVLDKEGRKFSKSLGNGVAPQEIIDQYGADILRLWVAGSDYHTDIRVGDEMLKLSADMYRRFRNTLRYVLGNLNGFTAAERVDLDADCAKLPQLEQWVLHRLSEVNAGVRKAVAVFNFHQAFKLVYDFCNADLSAFYFDIRKDRLYCDRPDLFERRATRSVLEVLLDALCTWLSPFIPFTAEETWRMKPDSVLAHHIGLQTVQERTYLHAPAAWSNDKLAKQWERVRAIRRVVTGAIEIERAEKRLGSSLEAHPVLYLEQGADAAFKDLPWDDLAITSQFTVKLEAAPGDAYRAEDVAGVAVVVGKAEGRKCQRSWKILPEVGSDKEFPDVTKRDADAVRHYLQQQKAA